MPIRTALWKVGAKPQPLTEAGLANEQLLEEMIVAAPQLLSDEWMLIGRQEDTGLGGRIDLLAIAPDGSLILIEIKRDRTPREVVAQALDYASWVEKLDAGEIAEIYRRFKPNGNLDADFLERFRQDLDEETLNENHEIVLVAGSLDPSSERIVAYLNERSIPINVLCFQVFGYGNEQLLSRAWLLDPLDVQTITTTTPKGPHDPWNGEFYCSYGDRSWEDAVEFGFIAGGGNPWYSRTLGLLKPGDRVWVNVPGSGYVGVGRVTGTMQPARAFMVETPTGTQPVLSVAKRAGYNREHADDLDRTDYFVPIHWVQTVPLKDAVHETGLFGNTNTICRPTTPKWRTTVERLKQVFTKFDQQ